MKLLGIGDNVVDRFLDRGKMYAGGQAMNVPVYAKHLGAESAYMGAFGDDEMGNLNRRFLRDRQVDTSRCLVIHGENACARVRTINGERIFLESNKGGVAKERPWNFTEEDGKYIAGFDVIHTDQNSYIEQDLPYLASLGPAISFDFSRKHDEAYLRLCGPWCTVCFISLEEDAGEEYLAETLRMAAASGVRIPVATMGESGSAALWKGNILREGIVQTDVADTMGAGDAFAAGFLTEVFRGSDITEEVIRSALKKGAAYASVICSLEGAHGHGVPFQLTEYERLLMKRQKGEG